MGKKISFQVGIPPMEPLIDGAKIGNLPEKTIGPDNPGLIAGIHLSVVGFSIFFLLLINCFEHLSTALYRGFGELLAAAQLSDNSDVTVFALIPLQCTVDGFIVFNIDYDHI